MKSIASGLSVLAVCGAVLTTLAPFAQAQATKPAATPSPAAKNAKTTKTTKTTAKKGTATTGKMAHKTTKPAGKMAPKPTATPKAK